MHCSLAGALSSGLLKIASSGFVVSVHINDFARDFGYVEV